MEHLGQLIPDVTSSRRYVVVKDNFDVEISENRSSICIQPIISETSAKSSFV